MKECSPSSGVAEVDHEEIEVCADHNVRYEKGGGAERLEGEETLSGVSDAEVCRAKCIQSGRCKFWTWGEDRKCDLIR